MKPTDDALWKRLAGFEIGDPEAPLSFTARLARENGWEPEFAERVVEEYRRFLFLVARAGHVVTPSEEVDQAWHLHLVYTRSYWTELCEGILGQPLHHCPTTGGLAQGETFRDQYEATLASYEAFFGEAPPEDIWPHAERRFAAPAARWVDTSRNWVIGKPRWWRSLLGRLPAMATLVAMAAVCSAVLLVGCQELGTYLKLDGTEFLLAYVFLIPITVIASAILERLFRGRGMIDESLSDPFEVAILGGGGRRAVDAALAQLFGRGWIEPVRGSARYEIKRTAGIDSGEAVGFERTVLSAMPETGSVSLPRLRRSLTPAVGILQGRLREARLIFTKGQLAGGRFVMVLPFLLLLGIGVARLIAGLERDKPVGFLALLLVLTVIVLLFRLSFFKRRTANGQATWRDIRRKHRRELKRLGGGTAADNVGQIAFAVAVVGPAVLNATPGYAGLEETLNHPSKHGATTTGGCGAGCGSDGGGSGGGDGGCGGGGCGGCGGCGG